MKWLCEIWGWLVGTPEECGFAKDSESYCKILGMVRRALAIGFIAGVITGCGFRSFG
jgi:hypothetical protein